MTPKITRQTKIVIRDKHTGDLSHNSAKFTAMDPAPTVTIYLRTSLLEYIF